MKLLSIGLLVIFALAGCANTATDIDFSKASPDCAQKCHANYSTCLGTFMFFPIVQQNQCVDSLKACALSCPAKNSNISSDADSTPPSNITMEKAKAKCLDLGFKAGTESFGQCVLKISK
jgi:hypothetical protein